MHFSNHEYIYFHIDSVVFKCLVLHLLRYSPVVDGPYIQQVMSPTTMSADKVGNEYLGRAIECAAENTCTTCRTKYFNTTE